MAKVHGELRPADAHVVQAVPPKLPPERALS